MIKATSVNPVTAPGTPTDWQNEGAAFCVFDTADSGAIEFYQFVEGGVDDFFTTDISEGGNNGNFTRAASLGFVFPNTMSLRFKCKSLTFGEVTDRTNNGQRLVGQMILDNRRGNGILNYNVESSEERATSTSWTLSTTVGLKVGANLTVGGTAMPLPGSTIEISADVWAEASFNLQSTNTQTLSLVETFTHSATYTVDPGQGNILKFYFAMAEITADFELLLEANGQIGSTAIEGSRLKRLLQASSPEAIVNNPVGNVVDLKVGGNLTGTYGFHFKSLTSEDDLCFVGRIKRFKSQHRSDHPPVNRGMIHVDPALVHEFFDMAGAQRIRQIPADPHENDL